MPIDHVARAKQAWPILANLANNNSAPITYSELCRKLGLHHRSATWLLGVIQSYCHHNELPALQASKNWIFARHSREIEPRLTNACLSNPFPLY